MSFVAVTHNDAQSTSPTHQTSEPKASSGEKKQFSLSNLTEKFKWFNKTKDLDHGGSVPLQTRSTQQFDGRCEQKPRHHGRHSPTDLLECVDRIEEDITLTDKKDEDIRVLRERCDAQYQQIKTPEKRNSDLNEQVKHFQSEYCVELEENEALKLENKGLRHQLDDQTSVSCLEDTNSEEETIANYKKAITSLKQQVNDLSDDLAKLRDHSKEQSRQILKLRQQTDMIEPMETQIKSEITIRQKAEEESKMIREELKKASMTATTLQTERKNLDAELKAMKEESARFIKDQNELRDLRGKYANLVDEHEQVLKSMRAMATLSAQLAESERTVRALERQLESTVLEKNELHDQLQVQWKADFEKEKRDRKIAQSKVADLERTVTTYQEDNEGLHKQLVEHQHTLSAIEVLNQKLTKEVRLAREKSQGLEQDIQAKSSQVKQYAKEVERLKQQLQNSTQAVGSDSMKDHNPSDNDAGFAHMNDLYKTALDDNEHLSSMNSDLHKEVEKLNKVNTELMEKLCYLSTKIQGGESKQEVAIQDGMPEGVPQILPSPSSESHVTLSQAQEASSVAESQQIILSAPVPVVPRTTDRSSTPQSLPDQFKTPELLVDNSVLQQGDDDTHRSRAIPPSPPSSKAKISPKPLHRKPITDTNGHEVERIVSESSSQSLPDPVGDSSDSQRDDIVHGETANVEDSITQYENPLQKELDDEIHQQAADVIKEVSGGRRNVKTDRQRPFDPNLVCPMCRRQFRIGEIQKFKKHVNTCTGTDDNN